MIYLVRHGQTDWNLEGRNQGQTDIELNQTGIQQAEEILRKLLDVKFDICYTSPLKRALKTCEIIYKGKFVVDERITERGNGELEGQINVQGKINFNDPNDTRFGVEPLQHFQQRLGEFWDEVLEKYYDKNVLVVTHAGVGIWTQVYFYGIPEDGNYLKYKTKNCDILQLEKKYSKIKFPIKYDEI